MKFLKKMMQVGLAVFFFGLLATSTVFADTTGGQFVDKDNRKYYIKDDHKAIYWHKIDGKTYYFGDKGEMVVGWQYIEIPATDSIELKQQLRNCNCFSILAWCNQHHARF